MTVPATTLSLTGDGDGPQSRASAGELLNFASGDDFVRWERQLAATGNCANPVRLRGRIDAIDRATGEKATIYDTASEPGGVLRIPCGNRREDICPPCSDVYKGDARQIIRSGLTGGKGIPESVATHPCVFATLTAPGFGPVHTIPTGRGGRLLACRPRRDAHQRRCPHGRDLSCARHHREDDPRLGTPMCPDCYDYTGHVLFNALAPELWRRFTIYLPRQLARLAGVTQRQLRRGVRVRFVKVAEYQHRGIIHYHAVIRLDAAGDDYQPPPPRYTAQLLEQAIRATVAAVRYDAAAVTGDDPPLRHVLRFGTQTDIRAIRQTTSLPGTGNALSAQAVANYIAKYATKTINAAGLPGSRSILPLTSTRWPAASTTSSSSRPPGISAKTPLPPSSGSTGGLTLSAPGATSSPNPAATRSPSPRCAGPASATAAPSGTRAAKWTPGAAASTTASC